MMSQIVSLCLEKTEEVMGEVERYTASSCRPLFDPIFLEYHVGPSWYYHAFACNYITIRTISRGREINLSYQWDGKGSFIEMSIVDILNINISIVYTVYVGNELI